MIAGAAQLTAGDHAPRSAPPLRFAPTGDQIMLPGKRSSLGDNSGGWPPYPLALRPTRISSPALAACRSAPRAQAPYHVAVNHVRRIRWSSEGPPRWKPLSACASALFSSAIVRRRSIHRPPLSGSINCAQCELRRVIMHQSTKSCLQSFTRELQFLTSPKSLKNSARFDLAVASAPQIHSYPLPSRFSVLVCPWYSPTNSIELGSLRSPGTWLTVCDVRCHRGQRKLGSRS
jgi:hypothetical protein